MAGAVGEERKGEMIFVEIFMTGLRLFFMFSALAAGLFVVPFSVIGIWLYLDNKAQIREWERKTGNKYRR